MAVTIRSSTIARLSVSALLLAVPAQAAYVTGAQLAAQLKGVARVFEDKGTEDENVLVALASGYILSVVDSEDRELFCIPNGTTAERLVTLVADKLEDEQLHYRDGDAAVSRILGAEFPCAEKSP